MRRFLAVGLSLVCGAFVWFAIVQIRNKRIQREHEAFYQTRLREYGASLTPGMNRAQVDGYLQTRGVPFFAFCCKDQEYTDTDAVKIGEESAPWYCSSTYVYIEFQFSTGTNHSVPRDPSDQLKKIEIDRKLANCL